VKNAVLGFGFGLCGETVLGERTRRKDSSTREDKVTIIVIDAMNMNRI